VPLDKQPLIIKNRTRCIGYGPNNTKYSFEAEKEKIAEQIFRFGREQRKGYFRK
jgi:hypothetical protein